MQHPIRAHIKTLELLMVELAFDFNQETEAVRKIHLADRIHALHWVLRCYRIGLDAEERLVAKPR